MPSNLLRYCITIILLVVALRAVAEPINTPGPVTALGLADIDGDGRDDVVVTTRGGTAAEPVRRLHVYLQKRPATLSDKPDMTVALPTEAATIHLVDVDDKPGRDIVLRTREGLVAFERDDRGQLLEQTTLVVKLPWPGAVAAGEDIQLHDDPVDVNGDGRDDLLLPVQTGYRLLLGKKGGGLVADRLFEAAEKVDYRVGWAGYSSHWFTLTRTVPAAGVVDHNGDGRLDVMMLVDNTQQVFMQRRGGGFAPRPIEHTLFGREEGEKDQLETRQILRADINGDRRTDYVVIITQGKLSLFDSFVVRIHVFFNKPRTGIARRPDQIIKLKGAAAGPETVQLADLTGDGKLDLVVPVVKTDLLSNIAKALSKTVHLSYFVFAFETQYFSRAPIIGHEVTVPFDIVEGQTGLPVARFEGDVDGDGRVDMIYPLSEDRIEAYPVRRDKSFFGGVTWSIAGKASQTVKTAERSMLRIADVDGNGRVDIITVENDDNDEPTRLRVTWIR